MQAGGRRFDPGWLHQVSPYGRTSSVTPRMHRIERYDACVVSRVAAAKLRGSFFKNSNLGNDAEDQVDFKLVIRKRVAFAREEITS